MYERTKMINMALLLGTGIVAFLAYMPSLAAGFLNWDDQFYVTNNPSIRSLDMDFIIWAFTSTEVANWHPLTWISYAVDYWLFGPGPFGFHLTNVILHSINTSLVFVLASELTRAADGGSGDTGALQWRRAVVGLVSALLFALHPIHVESVAWVSERKDLLYSLFYISGLITYIKYASGGRRQPLFYISTLAAFALSLMGKPMAITFPAVLLILDYYPLRRLSVSREGLRVLVEKIPFAAIAFTSALMAMFAQEKVGALASLDSVPVMMRVLVALRGYAFYIVKLLFPVDLAPFYPYPDEISMLKPEFIGAAALLLTITVLCLVFRRQRLFMAVWAYFIVSLAPVSGLAQVGVQAAADRYMYMPSLGFFILAGALAVYAGGKASRSALERPAKSFVQAICAFVTIAILAVLGAATVKQEAVWKEPVAFWTHELSLYPSFTQGYVYKGRALHGTGRYEEAMVELKKALELDPAYAAAYNEIGIVYGKTGRFDESIGSLTRATELDPAMDRAFNNRGYTYFKAGEYGKAIEDFNRAVELNPANGGAYYNLSQAYAKTGNAEFADLSLKRADAFLVDPDAMED